MRRFTLPFALAAVLVAGVALAQSDRVTAEFSPLQASGISGDAKLNPMVQQGTTRIQVQLKGLQPNTEYVSSIFQGDATCTSGVPTVITNFTSNPAGIAVFHKDVSLELSTIRSISVQLASDPAVLACAGVTP